jgi:hypothetical protein
MRKVKVDKLKKHRSIVLVSPFHSDEVEPWTYENRHMAVPLNEFKGDIRMSMHASAPMRVI